MPSSSPQWDSRNRGFISPAELQQLRQSSPGRDVHDFPARPPTNDSSASPQAQDNPNDNSQHTTQPRPMPPSSQSHARTSSFFSFRSKPHQEPVQDTSPKSPSPSALHNRRPSNPKATSPTDFGGPAPQMGQSKSLGPTRSPTDQQPDQQPLGMRRASLAGGQPAPAPLHPEIRSVVQLTLAHARKVYFSGPLVKRLERQPDGQRPLKDDGWVEVWAQLGGTTLSIWDMRDVEEANKQGREVPPTYFNTTDAVRFRLLVLPDDLTMILVRSSSRLYHCSHYRRPASEKIHERAYSQYCWLKSLIVQLSIDPSFGVMGNRTSAFCLGKIAA